MSKSSRAIERAKNGGSTTTAVVSDKISVGVKKNSPTVKMHDPHVVEHNGNWAVKSARAGRFVTEFYPNKSEAIDAGRRIARDSGSELLVHGKNGQIFQHSPVPSTLAEDIIRQAIRSAKKELASVKKPSLSRSLKKSPSKKK